MIKKDVQLGEAEGERIGLVDQRHLHLIGQPLRKERAQLQPTKPRPEDHHPALHPLSMLPSRRANDPTRPLRALRAGAIQIGH
jgi:hypothetical protein